MQKNIKNKNNNYKKDPIHKCISTPYDISLFESKLFHFLYSYILLNPTTTEKSDKMKMSDYEQKESEISEIWKEMIIIINCAMYD